MHARTQLVTAAALVLTFAAAAAAQNSSTDARFIATLRTHHANTIAIATLAVDKANNAEIQTFAKAWLAEVRSEMDDLDGFAAAPTVASVTNASYSAPDRAGGSEVSRLEGLSGPAFDVAFMGMVMQRERSARALVRNHAASGSNPDVTAFSRRIGYDIDATMPDVSRLMGVAKMES